MTPVLTSPAWRRAEDIAVVEREDRVVVLNLDDLASPPVVLEGTAATIWRLLDQADTEATLVAAVAEAFDLVPATVREDVHAFLRHLNDLGLVTRSGEST
jgi:hypothetical protein